MFDIVLGDLKGRFGPKVLLSPEDIADIIGVTVGQQANLRSDQRFKIPHGKDDFGRIKISIYDLANYIANQGKAHVKQELAQVPDCLTRIQKKAKKGHLSKNWWLFRSQPICSIIIKANLEFELGSKSESKKFSKV